MMLLQLSLFVLPMVTLGQWILSWLKQIYGLLFCICKESHWCTYRQHTESVNQLSIIDTMTTSIHFTRSTGNLFLFMFFLYPLQAFPPPSVSSHSFLCDWFPTCLSHCRLAVERHHDHNISSEREHLTGALLTVGEA